MKGYRKVKDNIYYGDENFVKKADQFFLAVAVNEHGQEGVVSFMDLNSIPLCEKTLMGASIADRDAIMEKAKEACEISGVKIRILRYSKCEVIKEFIPSNFN